LIRRALGGYGSFRTISGELLELSAVINPKEDSRAKATRPFIAKQQREEGVSMKPKIMGIPSHQYRPRIWMFRLGYISSVFGPFELILLSFLCESTTPDRCQEGSTVKQEIHREGVA